MAQAQEESNWQRHPTLYLPDGSIVFLAETTLFKVYHGLLSVHSDAFRGMMASAGYLPADADTYDGCPLVRIPEKGDDLGAFLGALLGTTDMRTEILPLAAAKAILSLSTKYMMDTLRNQIIGYFERFIPIHYDPDLAKLKERWTAVFNTKPRYWPSRSEYFSLAVFFHELNVLHFLPWFLYLISEEGLVKILEIAPGDEEYAFRETEVMRKVTLGCKRLEDASRDDLYRTILSKHPECTDPKCNNDLRIYWLKNIEYTPTISLEPRAAFLELERGVPHVPAYWYEHWCQDPSDDRPAPLMRAPCVLCRTLWIRGERDRSRHIWDSLPWYFKIDVENR